MVVVLFVCLFVCFVCFFFSFLGFSSNQFGPNLNPYIFLFLALVRRLIDSCVIKATLGFSAVRSSNLVGSFVHVANHTGLLLLYNWSAGDVDVGVDVDVQLMGDGRKNTRSFFARIVYMPGTPQPVWEP